MQYEVQLRIDSGILCFDLKDTSCRITGLKTTQELCHNDKAVRGMTSLCSHILKSFLYY